MAHNFKLKGNYYVSLNGNDANAGTVDAPFRTIKFAVNFATANDIIVVGSGVYKEESISISSNAITVIGDGKVILMPADEGNIFFTSSPSNNRYWENIHFKNWGINDDFTQNPSYFQRRARATKCIFEKVAFFGFLSVGNHNYTNCIFIDCIDTINDPGTSSGVQPIKSIIINSKMTLRDCRASYIDPSSEIIISNARIFDKNCIEGIVTEYTSRVQYALTQKKDGSPITPLSGQPSAIGGFPDIYTDGNFNQDPEFLKRNLLEFFSVQSTSPLLDSGAFGNIGGVLINTLITLDDVELSTPQFTEDVSQNTISQSYEYTGVDGSGFVVTKAILINSNKSVILDNILMEQLFSAFDLTSSLVGANAQIFAVDDFTTGAGINPKRLTYEMRWSTFSEKPIETHTSTTGTRWDNGGVTTEGEWVKMELNSQPTIDTFGKGNGEIDHFPDIAKQVACKWIQLRITVRDSWT